MRTLCLSAVAAFLSLPLLAQDMDAPKDNDCDCKSLEKGWYCAKCDTLCGKDDVDKDGKHSCKEKAADCKVCVKSFFLAECCGTKHLDAGS